MDREDYLRVFGDHDLYAYHPLSDFCFVDDLRSFSCHHHTYLYRHVGHGQNPWTLLKDHRWFGDPTVSHRPSHLDYLSDYHEC